MARIVFDLDGTLIDSAPDIMGIANRILEREGKELISLPQARDFIGNGASVFVRKMRDAQGIPDSEHEVNNSVEYEKNPNVRNIQLD